MKKLSEEGKKAIELNNTIEQILSKTRHKLKLESKRHDSRFNDQLQQFRHLPTFFDSRQTLTKLNIMNNEDLFQRVKRYLIRKRMAKQLKLDHDDINKVYEKLEKDFQQRNSRNYIEPNCQILDFGEPRFRSVKSQRFQPQNHLTQLHLSNNNSLPKIQVHLRSNATKSTYDSNDFYYQIEEALEIEPNKRLQQEINEKKQREDEQREQREAEMEIENIVKKYGIEDATEKELEERIYKSFQTQANKLIIKQVKKKKNQEQQKTKNKPKMSAFLEHRIFGKPIKLQLPQPVQVQHPLTRKQSQYIDRQETRRQSQIILGQLSQRNSQILLECDQYVQKNDLEAMEQSLLNMEVCIDDVVERTTFQEKLQTLGFSQEEQYFIKKYLRQPGQVQKMLRKKQEKSVRMFKFENM